MATYILNNIKPLLNKAFIDLYTDVDGEDSNGYLYLLYKFTNSQDEKKQEYWLRRCPCYFNSKWIVIDNKCYTLFKFKVEDRVEVESVKKYGNICFSISDYLPIFSLWKDFMQEAQDVSISYIKKCKKTLNLNNKGSELSEPFPYSPNTYF